MLLWSTLTKQYTYISWFINLSPWKNLPYSLQNVFEAALRIVNTVFEFLCCICGMNSVSSWLFLWFLICDWFRFYFWPLQWIFNFLIAIFLLYAFLWVIPWHLNFILQRLGTLCLFHLHRRVGTYLPMKMEQCVPKRCNIKFRCRGITHRKAYNIQNMAKVWNQSFSCYYPRTRFDVRCIT